MTIGEQIKKYRLEKKLSQRALGFKLGISQQQIAQYERGTRTPKLETLAKIANALSVPLYELFDLTRKEAIDIAFDNMIIETNLADPKNLLIKASVQKEMQQKKLLSYFNNLNNAGRKIALSQLELLAKTPEYLGEDAVRHNPFSVANKAPTD